MGTKKFKPHATFDAGSDAIYVYLVDAPVDHTASPGDVRVIDYSKDGRIVGIEFLGVAGGVDLSDLPSRSTIEKLISDLARNIEIFA